MTMLQPAEVGGQSGWTTMTPIMMLADLGIVVDRLAIVLLLVALLASLAGSEAVKTAVGIGLRPDPLWS